jgi:hypothetical protein
MNDFDYTLALRVRHPSIDPRELTAELGFAPQHSWRAGERKHKTADEPEATYRETYWYGRLPSQRELIPYLPLESALMLGLLQMTRAEAFWRRILAEGGTVRFIVEIYGCDDFTLDLSPMTLAMLARSRAAISVDIHTELRAVA